MKFVTVRIERNRRFFQFKASSWSNSYPKFRAQQSTVDLRRQSAVVFLVVIPQGSASVVAFALAVAVFCFPFPNRRNRHFDRSCSRLHREQRSGEIRFSPA
jgi:hypothetical protein